MPDREKVITEIEDALSDNLAKVGHVYRMSLNGLKDKALKDALALLKDQEAVIHCIDCCYYHKPEYGFTFGDCTRRNAWYQVNEKDYCSLAKRKESR